jgi:hypothetical protein
MNEGDYVLASKYDDGDPGDHYCVGFYAGVYDHHGQTRHLVNDADGKPFRANGFRRCEPVTKEEGEAMIASFADLKPLEVKENPPGIDDELVGKSVWDRLAEIRAERRSAEPK